MEGINRNMPLRHTKTINNQSREIVFNLLQYMIQEKEAQSCIIPLNKVYERVVQSTGVSRSSVFRIAKEGAIIPEDSKFQSPRKTINKPSPRTTLNEFDEPIIRTVIYTSSIIHKRRLSMQGVLDEVKEAGVHFTGAVESFRKIVKSMGFHWKRTVDNKKILVEKTETRLKRTTFLRDLKRFKEEGRNIVYSDEMCLACSPFPALIGQRLIVLHCGGIKGFVPNAGLIFKPVKNGDHHDEMNTIYNNWLSSKVLPNLEKKSVLVIDNASYHNALLEPNPSPNWPKKDMQSWLTARQIAFDVNDTKPELYAKIKANKPVQQNFVIDALLENAGHKVLRLPPYHPELNPIENVWTLVKHHVAQCNDTFKLDDVRKLAEDKLNSFGVEEWGKICANVEKIEEEYMSREYIADEVQEEIVRVDGNSDSEDSDTCVSSDNEDDEGN